MVFPTYMVVMNMGIFSGLIQDVANREEDDDYKPVGVKIGAFDYASEQSGTPERQD